MKHLPGYVARRPGDAASQPRAPNGHRGFTLVELMTVVAIVAVLAAIATPSFTDMIARQRLRTGAFDLVGDLLIARSEAIKRNETVTVTANGADWAQGWIVEAAGGDVIQRHEAFGAGISSAGVMSIGFNRDGRASGTLSVSLTSANTSVADAARCVVVQPSGRAGAKKGAC